MLKSGSPVILIQTEVYVQFMYRNMPVGYGRADIVLTSVATEKHPQSRVLVIELKARKSQILETDKLQLCQYCNSYKTKGFPETAGVVLLMGNRDEIGVWDC
jgi:hypothetical protein